MILVAEFVELFHFPHPFLLLLHSAVDFLHLPFEFSPL
jgi:hypothetical protein